MADAERTGMSNSVPRNGYPRRPLTTSLSNPARNGYPRRPLYYIAVQSRPII